jgi:endoglucanase
MKIGAPAASAKPDTDQRDDGDLGRELWKYPIDEALGKSLLFYEAQRSGTLPADNRIGWRGDSATGDAPYDGGWYDAGDHVKFHLPLTYAAGRLAMSAWVARGALSSTTFQGKTNLHWTLREVRWISEYIIRCHPDANTFVAQVGDGNLDHAYLGRAEFMKMARPTVLITEDAPGADIVASASGALAQAALAFEGTDDAFAAVCLQNARSLYDFAVRTSESPPFAESAPFYVSTGIHHQLFFASASLFAATGDDSMADAALKWAMAEDRGSHAFYSTWIGWDNAWYEAAAIMLGEGRDTPAGDLATYLRAVVDAWVSGDGIKASPAGQAWLSEWGSNRYAANAAAVALLAARHFPDEADEYRCFAVSQLHYVWGDAGRSMVVGFGQNPPTHAHHRNAACSLADGRAGVCDKLWVSSRPNTNVVYGALVGGPTAPDDRYVDARADYQMTEVAVDYNAMYTLASALSADLGASFWQARVKTCGR